MKKNILIAGGVVALLVIAVIIFGKPTTNNFQSNLGNVSKEDMTPQNTERVIQADTKTVLSGFPDGFPAEKETAENSYRYIPANSTEQQYTLQYESQKTLAENEKIFKDYFTSAGFQIVNKQESATDAFYYGTRDNSDLSILISSRDGKISISASYLAR